METGFDSTIGWHEIADHRLVLRGLDELAKVVLRTNRVLAPSAEIHSPSAVAFDVKVTLPRRNSAAPVSYTCHFGCYGSLSAFCDSLLELRHGRKSTAAIEGAEGFRLVVFDHPFAGACVQGSMTSPVYSAFEPFPDNRAIGEAFATTDTTVAHTFQFAFKTSLVDPPLLDAFIGDLRKLLSHLESFAA